MLTASMVLGLVITNEMARAWPGSPTFAALHEHTSWLGLGQISLYLLLFVVVSFYLKRWINYKLWRALHSLSLRCSASACCTA